jgi:hypothetical protein
MWSHTQPVLIACLVSVAVAMTVDWFLDNPGGSLRVLSATIGLFVGASGWVDFISGGLYHSDNRGLTVMPWSFAIGWIAGSVLMTAHHRLTAAHAENRASRAIRRSAGWRIVPTAAGALTGISVLFFGYCYDYCSAVRAEAWQTVERVRFLHIDFLGVGNSPTVILVLAAITCYLYVAAPTLARVSRPLGVTAAITGPVLGIIVLLAYSPNLVTLLAGSIAGSPS